MVDTTHVLFALIGMLLVDSQFDHPTLLGNASEQDVAAATSFYSTMESRRPPWNLAIPVLVLIGFAMYAARLGRHRNLFDLLSLPGFAFTLFQFVGRTLPARQALAAGKSGAQARTLLMDIAVSHVYTAVGCVVLIVLQTLARHSVAAGKKHKTN